jgi:hypothetical protein
MKLTKYQLYILNRTYLLHTSGLSFRNFINKKILICGLVGIFASFLEWILGLHLLSMVLLGMGISYNIFVIRMYFLAKRLKPLTEQITDWKKVEQLLNENKQL